MSSARVIAPTSMGIQKLLTRANVNAVIDSTAKVLMKITGFIGLGYLSNFPRVRTTAPPTSPKARRDKPLPTGSMLTATGGGWAVLSSLQELSARKFPAAASSRRALSELGSRRLWY